MSRFRDKKQKAKEQSEIVRCISLITQLGVIMTTTVFISVFIGIYLDKIFNTKFIFILIFSILGLGAAFRNMYIVTNKKS